MRLSSSSLYWPAILADGRKTDHRHGVLDYEFLKELLRNDGVDSDLQFFLPSPQALQEEYLRSTVPAKLGRDDTQVHLTARLTAVCPVRPSAAGLVLVVGTGLGQAR